MFPSHSHVLPNGRIHPPKADLRAETSAWKALVWAYADECVTVATNVPDSHHLYVQNGLSQLRSYDGIGGGTINAALDAHEDAFAIDAFLWKACGCDHHPYEIIARRAARRAFMPQTLAIEPLRCGPKLRDNGKPETLLNGRRMPYLCLVDYAGVTAEEADVQQRRHKALYDLFLAVLDAMQDLPLSKWRIVRAL